MAEETVTDPALAQIVGAPRNAYYIVSSTEAKFTTIRRLREADRMDLTVLAKADLLRPGARLASWPKRAVVVDHGCGDMAGTYLTAIAAISS